MRVGRFFGVWGLDNDSCGKDGLGAQEAGNQRGKFMDFSKAMKQGSEGIGSKRGSAVFTRTAQFVDIPVQPAKCLT